MKARELIKLLSAVDSDFEVMLVELKTNKDEDVEHHYDFLNGIEINIRQKSIGFVINPTFDDGVEVQE